MNARTSVGGRAFARRAMRSVRAPAPAAERAFGEHLDVDGMVSYDGDVLVRLTWDKRHPVPARVLELVGPAGGPSLWPAACLVTPLLLYDRQELALNWWSISNMLVASPAGHEVEVPLSALVASLASVRRPEDMGMVLLARPHTLPAELERFPHLLLDPVDSADAAAVGRALDSVRQELDRHLAASQEDLPDLLLVVRELGDVEGEALEQLAAIAAAGPRVGIRVLAASEMPATELLQACPFLERFGTRLVLQARDEEESVELLGMHGAEDLGAGGHAICDSRAGRRFEASRARCRRSSWHGSPVSWAVVSPRPLRRTRRRRTRSSKHSPATMSQRPRACPAKMTLRSR